MRSVMGPSLLALSLCIVAHAQLQPDIPSGWTYDVNAANGPNNWGDSFNTCAAGQHQSPIDINTELVVHDDTLADLAWFFVDTEFAPMPASSSSNFAHVWDIASTPDQNSVVMGSSTYFLKQVRLHNNAEHTVNGVGHAFEGELLFKEFGGPWLIYSVLGTVGGHNAALDGIPAFDGMTTPANFNFDASSFIPADGSYMVYEGSLSTPDCNQDTPEVHRVVAAKQIYASEQQIFDIFVRGSQSSGVSYAQVRPVQPVNDRVVRFHQQQNFAATSSCTAVSRFFEDVDGWNINTARVEEIVTLHHRDGKFVEGVPRDDADYVPWRFAAKNEFRGDLRHLVDGVLRFRLKVCSNTPVHLVNGNVAGDVVITGDDFELVGSVRYAPSTAFFTQYEMSLSAGPVGDRNWNIRPVGSTDMGTPVDSNDQIMSVLSYVKCIGIRGYWNDDDATTVWLDDAEICDGANPVVPCPGEDGNQRMQCSGHGNCVNGACQCHWGWTEDDCSEKKKCAIGRFPLPEPVAVWKEHDEGLNPLP